MGRKLSGAEIASLQKVYGNSIDYSGVRIKEGDAGLLSLGGRPFTHGDTVYVPKGALPLSNDTLIHELAHVWQYQHGGSDYLSEALVAQTLGEGYDWMKGVDEGKSWSQLNPEQQAELIETANRSGFFEGPGRTFVYGGKDYTAYLNRAVAELRAGRGAP